jgi:hypothetical protein
LVQDGVVREQGVGVQLIQTDLGTSAVKSSDIKLETITSRPSDEIENSTKLISQSKLSWCLYAYYMKLMGWKNVLLFLLLGSVVAGATAYQGMNTVLLHENAHF